MRCLRRPGANLNHSTVVKRIAQKPKSLLFRSSSLITNKNSPKVLTSISSIVNTKQKDRVFLVGGGSSLRSFNFKLLKNEDTICVNSSVFDVPRPNFFITKDYSFLLKHLINCLQTNYNAVKVWNNVVKIFVACYAGGCLQDTDGEIVDVPNEIKYDLCPVDWIIKNDKQWGISSTLSDFRCGVDSGYGALQLAILLGYKEIYLLGYDLQVRKKTHYHVRYGTRIVSEFQKKLDGYLRLYIEACQKIKNMNQVKLISCSSISKLNSHINYIPIKKIL